MGEDAGRGWRRATLLRFTALRRQTYLAVLEETGNLGAAADAIGFRRNRMDAMRRRDTAFDADCRAALAAAAERLKDAEGPFEGVEDGAFNTIRRCRNGRVQIIAVGPGRWSKRVEDRYFELLAQSGNVEASARAVGFAGTDMFRRRRQWPGFARRWEEALEEAEVRLEFRLACWGNPVPVEEGEDSGGMGTVTSNCPPREVIPFDPEFALKFLKWREEKRRGYGQRGRPRKGPPERTFKEAVDSILGKIEAIERHEKRYGKRET